MNIHIGFDFSMNKPAMTIYFLNKFYFYIWPLNMVDKKLDLYKNSDVHAISRNLNSISPENFSFSLITLEHTKRSINLANMIIKDIQDFINHIKTQEPINLYISSEGLSFGSIGDAALNLATYKGVLLAKLYENFNDNLKFLYTYSPITIKSIAGCAGKKDKALKAPMINAFINDDFILNNKFKENLISGILTAKTNYIPCVDDIVDSYWALKTMLIKEKYI